MTPLLLCFILASDLHTAARAGDIDTVTALIARGADVNEYDSLGGTPLHDAAWSGEARIVELLIEHRANVNARHKEAGSTPLHYAALMDRREVAQILLAHGALGQRFDAAAPRRRPRSCRDRPDAARPRRTSQ
jgi:ankyrin repeat protein